MFIFSDKSDARKSSHWTASRSNLALEHEIYQYHNVNIQIRAHWQFEIFIYKRFIWKGN